MCSKKNITAIAQWLKDNEITYESNADLSKKTWIKNGGTAQLYITPENMDQLEHVLLRLSESRQRYIAIGHTSNMFFSNSYDPSIILSTKKLTDIIIAGNKIFCECGASLTKVATLCVKEGIAGYQGLVGIPGTVGAAVCNNSGAYECEMSNIVERVEVLLSNGEKAWFTNSDLEFSYRDSAIKSGKIKGCVLRVELSAQKRKSPEILQSMVEENAAKRKKYYESYDHNLGTVFSRMDICSERIFLRALLKILRWLTMFFPPAVQNKTRKFLILAYFNKLKLYPYISEKRMNCFIWNKNKKYDDKIFYDYVEFIKSKSFVKAVLEVQIIDEIMDREANN